MQINVFTRHGSMAEATRQKITEKMEKLGRLLDKISRIDITVDMEKEDVSTVDVLVATDYKKDFSATYSSDNLFGAVDQVLEKVSAQIRKFKEKMTEH
ncbi:MAG: ribosome-associated translation inhibitor RaiA [Planctomycetia bacterium]|nr:ribosome-associated translation inhibitor RaiA [Planctomycetia bacterium]